MMKQRVQIIFEEGLWIGVERLGSFAHIEDGELVVAAQHSSRIEVLYRAEKSVASKFSLHIDEGACVELAEYVQIAEGVSLGTQTKVEVKGRAELRHSYFEPYLHGKSNSSFIGSVQAGGSVSSTMALASRDVRRNSEVTLFEGASASIKGLFFADQEAKHEIFSSIDHRGANTTSSQQFKSIVGGSARIKSSSLLCKEAVKAKSCQLSRFLALHERAVCCNEPYLQVLADDVTATHGATTGCMDEQLIWYMNSRGICLAEARQMYVEGFCREMLTLLPKEEAELFVSALKGKI